MKIACYGHLAEVIGREITFPQGDGASDIGALRQILAAAYPGITEEITGPRIKTLVDEQFVSDEYALNGDELVEFLPPVSGG